MSKRLRGAVRLLCLGTFVAGLAHARHADYSANSVPVVPFHNGNFDVAFYTASQDEVATIESRSAVTGWTQDYSLGSFRAWTTLATAPADAVPVCRFYWPQLEWHFFTAFAPECAGLIAAGSPWLLETPQAFYVLLPDAWTGSCHENSVPVYRLWGSRGHYFTTSSLRRSKMLVLGYQGEGYGDLGVAFCTPPAPSGSEGP